MPDEHGRQVFDAATADGLAIGLILLDANCRVAYWNRWLERHTGIAEADILGENLLERFPEIRERGKDHYITDCLQHGTPALLSPALHHYLLPIDLLRGDETVRMHQHVKLFPVEESSMPGQVLVVIEDLTEQILAEREMARLNRVLASVRNVNQLLVRAESREELFTECCRILVSGVGYCLVWVGLVEDGSFEVKRVASAGVEEDTLTELHVPWDDSSGVTGSAINSGEPQVVDSIEEDTASRPWRALARRIGSQSVCSLPLRAEGRVVGALNVHAAGRGTFRNDELSLLVEVADDISYCLQSLEDRRRRQNAERKLEKRNRYLEEVVNERTQELQKLSAEQRILLDSVRAMIWFKDTKNNVLKANRAAAESTGLPAEDVEGKSFEELCPQDAAEQYAGDLEVIESGKPRMGVVEARRTSANKTIWVLSDKIPYRDRTGNVTGVVVLEIDITERKLIEEALAKRSEEREKMLKAMVGRELRMVELKKEVRGLRLRLEEEGVNPIAD